MYCGHCEVVCPNNALTHLLSQIALKSAEEGNLNIDSVTLSQYFQNRRSIRNYLLKPVDNKILEQLMDTVRYAPTGGNRQLNQWIIVSGKEMKQKLTDGAITWMKAILLTNPELAGGYNFQAVITAVENGVNLICRNAPHVVVGYTAGSHTGGVRDSIIAASHLELLAPSFGLGTCWAGFLMTALQYSPELKKILGIDEASNIHAALMLGYPKFKYYRIPARDEADVKWL